METKVYNQQGEEAGSVKLSPEVFGLPWNADLVHQVVVSMQSNARQGTAAAKTRGEVRGGGKKPWKQKGTGRARHGSIRSPLWKGGGVTHGPLAERNYSKKINQKMKIKALFTVLSQKWRDGELVLMNDLVLAHPKTKEARAALLGLAKVKGLEKLAYKKGNRALVSFPLYDENIIKSFRNLAAWRAAEVRNLNPVDILNYKYLVLVNPEKSLAALESRRLALKK